LKHIEERNDAQYELTKKTTKKNCEKLQRRSKAPKRENRKAKRKCQNKLARKYKDEDFAMVPEEEWKVCREIEKVFSGHLPNMTLPQFAKPDWMDTTSDGENADILKKHFQAVFGRKGAMTDETVIDDIVELDIEEDLKEELRSIPEMEVKKAITKMKRKTAPGVSSLALDMLKSLPEKAMEHLTLMNSSQEVRKKFATLVCQQTMRSLR
jgi:hypothetical protein